VAEKIRLAIEQKDFLINESEIVKITASIGIYSEIPKPGEEFKSFLGKADKKLYEAKNSGRNRVCG
jgi:diguanylate cyclase (GGDEF)-like protein